LRSFRLSLTSALLLASLPPAISAAGPSSASAQTTWVGTWAAAPMAGNNPNGTSGGDTAGGSTLRETVHVSLGGSSVRVILTNEFGKESLTIGGAQMALPAPDGAIVPASAKPLTFSGSPSVTIPPGALAISDPVEFQLKPLSDLSVSLYLPQQPLSVISVHGFADTTNYLCEGNQLSAATLTATKKIYSWNFLKGVDVQADRDAGAIVAFGDSITDGAKSTRDANARWPDVLAARLAADKKTSHLGVLNQGIGGNRILHDGTGPSALARFDRDVIAQAGVKYLIILESINDIGHAADPKKPYDVVSADDLIAGFSQMARRAHTHGIKVIGATLTPYVSAGYQSPAGEAMRQAVNQWIRTTKELDGVIDFDKVTSDPAHPDVFLPADDSGDHLHPNDAGYKAMGNAIDLKLFTK
jgi:lysophospholipase L1-like esterase